MEEKDKRYLRIESVVYVKMMDGETMEEAEDRFLSALPDDIDIATYKITKEA